MSGDSAGARFQPVAGVEAVRADELARIREGWLAAFAKSPDAVPFSHPDWYATWLRHFPAPSALFLVSRQGDEVTGVIPLVPAEGGAAGLGNPKVQDYAGIFVAPGREGDVALGLREWLTANGFHTCTLWGIREADPLADALGNVGGWLVEEEREAVAPVADLGKDWEAFVASLSKHDRHELRRKLRNLLAAGEARLDVLADPAEVTGAMDTLLEMMRASHEGKARFLSAEMEAFFRDLAPAMAAAGPGRAWRLTFDGRIVALLLGFQNESTWFLYNSGYDPEYGRLAVGLLSKALAMQAAIAAGRTRFDFLRGEEEYKRRLGGTDRVIRRLRLTRAPG